MGITDRYGGEHRLLEMRENVVHTDSTVNTNTLRLDEEGAMLA